MKVQVPPLGERTPDQVRTFRASRGDKLVDTPDHFPKAPFSAPSTSCKTRSASSLTSQIIHFMEAASKY
eukprot:5902753-Prymnesium_polylepis.1